VTEQAGVNYFPVVVAVGVRPVGSGMVAGELSVRLSVGMDVRVMTAAQPGARRMGLPYPARIEVQKANPHQSPVGQNRSEQNCEWKICPAQRLLEDFHHSQLGLCVSDSLNGIMFRDSLQL